MTGNQLMGVVAQMWNYSFSSTPREALVPAPAKPADSTRKLRVDQQHAVKAPPVLFTAGGAKRGPLACFVEKAKRS